MSIKLSTGLRSFLLRDGSLQQAFTGGTIELYTGSQTTSADDGDTGTLLATITLASGTHTNEVRSAGSVRLDTGASGSVSSITVNSIEILGATVNFTTDLPTTGGLIAAQINRYLTKTGIEYTASSDGLATPTITITASYGSGTGPNGWTLATTAATITKTDTNMGSVTSGVAQVNGLTWGDVASGILSKSTDVWSATAVASGTIGHFRMKGPIADTSSSASTTALRLDGSIAVTGGDINISNTTVALSAPLVVTSWNINLPAT
jgi:hypothetical protein